MIREKRTCDECKSPYFIDSSEMMSLCPDCAYKLYGYPNCPHEFEKGYCKKCGWNGQTSEYLKSLEKKNGD